MKKQTLKKPIKIELCGLSGSGKSTLAKVLMKELTKKDFSIIDDKYAEYISISKWLKNQKNPTKGTNLLKLMNMFLPKQIMMNILGWRGSQFKMEIISKFEMQNKEFIKYLLDGTEKEENSVGKLKTFKNVFFKYQNIKQNIKNKDFVIIDEGVCSAICSNKDNERFIERIKKQTRYLAKYLDVVIFVDISPENSYKRIKQRETPLDSVDLNTKEEALRQLKIFRQNIKKIIQTLKKEGVRIYEIDNNKNLGASKNEINKIAEKIINEGEK